MRVIHRSLGTVGKKTEFQDLQISPILHDLLGRSLTLILAGYRERNITFTHICMQF